MRLIANKSMTYSTRRLAAGDLFTASSRDARILLALRKARQVEAEKPIEIPADWTELQWPELRALAASLSEEAIKTKADATAAIEAEIKRRAD